MKVISWNINGYRSAQKSGSVSRLYDLDADIICLQETKISDCAQMSDVPEGYRVYQQLSQDKGRNGVCVIAKSIPTNVERKLGYDIFDKQGRFIRCDFSDKISVMNFYMPHGGRDKKDLLYKLDVGNAIIRYMGEAKFPIKIVCGDFNIAHKEIDVARAKHNYNNTMFTQAERQLIDKIIENGFVDSFRCINSQAGLYSWWPYSFNAKERNIGWRIDYIFVSEQCDSKIINAKLLKEFDGSDHCPMLLDIKTE